MLVFESSPSVNIGDVKRKHLLLAAQIFKLRIGILQSSGCMFSEPRLHSHRFQNFRPDIEKKDRFA